jgi:hypothetical protein
LLHDFEGEIQQGVTCRRKINRPKRARKGVLTSDSLAERIQKVIRQEPLLVVAQNVDQTIYGTTVLGMDAINAVPCTRTEPELRFPMKDALIEAIDLPAPIEITDDMLPALKEEAVRHNESIERIKAHRAMPAKEQIRRAFEWNGEWNGE